MERIRSLEVAGHIGARVRVLGWLQSTRRLGEINFLTIRDGWGVVQAVAHAHELAALETGEGRPALPESVIEVEGDVRAEPRAAGGVELHGLAIRVIAPAAEPTPVPLGKNLAKVPLPALLDHAAVTNRHPLRRAVFRLAAAAMAGFRRALDERAFVELQSPKLVAGATEGGANVFTVDYFGRPAYLAQSPQLYKQIMVGAFERVYEVGPVFRAEPHDTARHVNQYTSLDVELGFIADHFDVMRLLVEVLRGMLETLRARCPAELELLRAELPTLAALPEVVPHIDFPEAQERIAAALGPAERGQPDLSPEGERWLGRWAKEHTASDFLFVVGYPLRKRPFYTHPDPARPELSRSFDLLFRGTELVTGGQRLHEHTAYLAALADRGMSAAGLEPYLEAFRAGMPPHGGFAIGLERFLMQLLGLSNIRFATLFPRDVGRLAP
jgi:nondiscriminating aspartyl-tRNA synthetase